jgi:hypothetical protein
MPLNRTASIRIIQISAIVFIAILIGSYALWRSLNYARGPHITIFEPLDGSSVSASVVTIKGRADRVNKIELNMQPISMDEQGNFSEMITIFPGTNILTFDASDQFNRSTETVLHLFGTVDFPIKSSVTASTTVTATSSTTI